VPTAVYRYSLWRVWDHSRPLLMVIGLNPSTADEFKLDPTLRRCAGFAYDWGLGGLVMTNLFAFRATDPIDMKASVDPIGPDNDNWLVDIATAKRELTFGVRPKVLAAWGTHGGWLGRDDEVVKLLVTRGVDLHCLVKTKHGFPKHPLYVKRDTRPQIYRQGLTVRE
jgi:hypothetical protein